MVFLLEKRVKSSIMKF